MCDMGIFALIFPSPTSDMRAILIVDFLENLQKMDGTIELFILRKKTVCHSFKLKISHSIGE